MENHRLWVVDKSKLFREGLKMLLQDSPFEVTREVSHLDFIRDDEHDDAERPALILIAVHSPLVPSSEEGISLLRICGEFGDTPIVVLSDAMSVNQLKAAMRAGASGYLLRDITPDALKQSLMLVMLGEKVLPTDLVKILVDGCEAQLPGSGETLAIDLSPREKRILRCLANGRPNKVIANELNITEGTVKVHIKAVFKKINARNRTEAAIWALSHGFDTDA